MYPSLVLTEAELGALLFRVQVKSRRGWLAAALVFLFASVVSSGVLQVDAASLTSTSIRFNRMSATTDTTFRLTFTVPAGNTGTEDDVRIGFPDDYTVATASLTANTASCGATALPGTLVVTGSDTTSSKNITISGVTNLSAATTYCVDIDRTSTNDPITNPGTGLYAVTVATRDSGDAVIDSATIGARVISNDQIVVSAVVPPSFNFVLDGNITAFASNLESGDVIFTNPRTVTITTNATQGWIAWARSSNTGLSSAAAGYTIASTTPGTGTTLTPGTEGYVLGVEATDAALGGTVTVEPAYVGDAGDDDGSGLDTDFRQIASANGTANGDVLTLLGKAAIAALTPAGVDYTDTWTIIGAGSF